MTWKIKWSDEAVNQLRKLDKQTQKKLQKYLSERVAKGEQPREWGKPLRYGMAGLWRYRVGDYRLVCKLEDGELVILVLRVGHRKNIYN